MDRICEFGFSDGAECPQPAKANIGKRWYCAEHYDNWIEYYRRHLYDGRWHIVDDGIEDVKRVLKNR